MNIYIHIYIYVYISTYIHIKPCEKKRCFFDLIPFPILFHSYGSKRAPEPKTGAACRPNGTAGSLRGGTRCWSGWVFKGWVHICPCEVNFNYCRWWQLKYFFIFTPSWGRFPIWLIFFRWFETTNQSPLRWISISHYSRGNHEKPTFFNSFLGLISPIVRGPKTFMFFHGLLGSKGTN